MAEQPVRDNGPFESAEQVQAQADAVLHGLALSPELSARLLLLDACTAVDVPPTVFEQEALAGLTPQMATIVCGLVMRAYMNGYRKNTG